MPTATLEELSNQRRSKKIGDGAETKETQVEEMLISGVLPIMSLYRLPHGQYGYSGHVINLPQDVGSFANTTTITQPAGRHSGDKGRSY